MVWLSCGAKPAQIRRSGRLLGKIHRTFQELADQVVAGVLAQATAADDFAQDTQKSNRAKPPRKLRSPQKRPLTVRLLGGLLLWVTTLYCAPSARSPDQQGTWPGGKWRVPGVGGRLGIQEGSSPALVQREVGRQVAACCPRMQALARGEMARRGLDLDIKEVYGIGKYAGAAALTYRRRLLESQYRAGVLPASGQRVGGQASGRVRRWRTHENPHADPAATKAGASTKPSGDVIGPTWREPKLLIIVELDQRGRMVAGEQAGAGRHVFEGSPDEAHGTVGDVSASVGRRRRHRWCLWERTEPPVGLGTVGLGHQASGLETESCDQDLGLVSCRACTSVWPWNTCVGDPDVRRRLFQKLPWKWLKQGDWWEVVLELAKRAKDVPADQSVWTELSYLERHGEEGHLDYARFRRRGGALG